MGPDDASRWQGERDGQDELSDRRFLANLWQAVSAASIICRMRVWSSGDKLHLGGAYDLVAKITAEFVRGAQIDASPAEQSG